jgi:hypothetical protein
VFEAVVLRVGEVTPSGDATEQIGGKISVRSFFDWTNFILHQEDIDCVLKVAVVFCSPSGEIPE